MIFLSIVITLVLDRVFNQFHSFRQFKWLQDYADWMTDVLSISRLPTWVSLVVLLLPLLLAVSFVQGIFAVGLFGLFSLAFNVMVLFLCLGPLDTDKQVDDYLHSLDTGDEQKQIEAASGIGGVTADSNVFLQASQVVKSVFTASHRRVFACLFWFVLLGAMGAIFYRLVEQSVKINIRDDAEKKLNHTFNELLAYLEWLPARITIGAFMIAGHFEGAFAGYRKATKEFIDVDETNQGILELGGCGAIQFENIKSDQQAKEQVKKARGLVLRSLVVWLVICLLLTWV